MRRIFPCLNLWQAIYEFLIADLNFTIYNVWFHAEAELSVTAH